jgi:hypothetical protein
LAGNVLFDRAHAGELPRKASFICRAQVYGMRVVVWDEDRMV